MSPIPHAIPKKGTYGPSIHLKRIGAFNLLGFHLKKKTLEPIISKNSSDFHILWLFICGTDAVSKNTIYTYVMVSRDTQPEESRIYDEIPPSKVS